MKSLILYIGFFFSLLNVTAQWDTVFFENLSPPHYLPLKYVDFIDESHGLAVGGWYPYITHDGGETWGFPFGIFPVEEFEFRDSGNAIMMDIAGSFYRLNIFSSEYEVMYYSEGEYIMKTMEMLNDSVVLTGGYEGIYKVDFESGVDTMWSFPSVGLSEPTVNSICRVNDSTLYAYAVGNSIMIVLKSIDYGSSWDTINPNTGVYGSLHFHTSEKLFIASGDGIYKSLNGGIDWAKMFCHPDTSIMVFRDILFTDDNNGYAVGGGSPYPEIQPSFIYKTTDGGENWYRQYYAQHGALYSVCFPIDSLGFACGEPNAILKTSNGGGIGVGVQNPRLKEISCYTYPNPFTTSTTIEFSLNGKSRIQISMFNTIGEKVYQAEENYDQGTHKITWSPGPLPAGVYYGVLKSEEGVSVLKIIKK